MLPSYTIYLTEKKTKSVRFILHKPDGHKQISPPWKYTTYIELM